jgi:hypothetical protein
MSEKLVSKLVYESLGRLHQEQIAPFPSGFQRLPYELFQQRYESHNYVIESSDVIVFHGIEPHELYKTLFVVYTHSNNITSQQINRCIDNHLGVFPNKNFLHFLPSSKNDPILEEALSLSFFQKTQSFTRLYINRNTASEVFLKNTALEENPTEYASTHNWHVKTIAELSNHEIQLVQQLNFSEPFRLVSTPTNKDFLEHRKSSKVFIHEYSRYIFNSSGDLLAYAEGILTKNKPVNIGSDICLMNSSCREVEAITLVRILLLPLLKFPQFDGAQVKRLV